MDIRIPVYENNGVFLHGISIAVGVIIVCGEILAPLVLTQQNHPAVSVDIGFFTGIVLRKDTFYRFKRAASYRDIPYAERIPDIFCGDCIAVSGCFRCVSLYKDGDSENAVVAVDKHVIAFLQKYGYLCRLVTTFIVEDRSEITDILVCQLDKPYFFVFI